jgi:hypothetical protein
MSGAKVLFNCIIRKRIAAHATYKGSEICSTLGRVTSIMALSLSMPGILPKFDHRKAKLIITCKKTKPPEHRF